MKQNKLYVAPKMEVIEVEPQGILCTSCGVEPSDFMGTGMSFTEHSGNWNY
jgi:hypothetical protein